MRVNLVSGGIDSYIMSQEYHGTNVYVDFGQQYKNEEISALKNLGVDFDIIKLTSKFQMNGIFVNNRNLTLASVVSMVYSPDEIFMAGLKDDNCIDKTESEFERMSEIISRYSIKPVKVISPYWHKTKGDIIAGFKDKQSLLKTFSCYNPINSKPCGNCPACLRKVIALETNGVNTGIKLSDNIIKEYLQKIHKYDQDRISRFFIYLNKISKVYAVDIDGVLCKEENKPYAEREFLTDINQKGYKVLYTSRLEMDRQVTEEWLKKHKIKYDALIMNKLPYSVLIDDRAKVRE